MKVFFDTNVLISGFITEGLCRRLLRMSRSGEFEGIVSRQVLDETERHLRSTFEYSEADVREALAVIHGSFHVTETPGGIPKVCRDPSDDAILAAALNAEADVLVTGDQDLLILRRSGKTRILRPADFLREMESAR